MNLLVCIAVNPILSVKCQSFDFFIPIRANSTSTVNTVQNDNSNRVAGKVSELCFR